MEVPVRDVMMMKMIRLVRSGVPWRRLSNDPMSHIDLSNGIMRHEWDDDGL